jgi:DNA-binding transcriptional LysR family regulator
MIKSSLCNRNSRNVSLTEAGARYLMTVRPLLEGLEEADAQVSETTLAATGTLKVSMPVWMANPTFARIISAYHVQNPNVVLDLDLSGRKINLVEEGVDLALRVTETLDEGFIARKLTMVEFPLVAAPAFLETVGRPKTTDDLNGAPFLIYDAMAASGRIRYGKGESAIDIKSKLVLQTGNETLIHLGACQGMGFAFLPHWLATDDLESGRLETVLPEMGYPRVPLTAIYPDRSFLPAKVRSFLDFLAGPDGFGKTGAKSG